MNYTTIKQSKKLLELGLNPKTADMYWGYDDHYTTTPKEKDYSIIANSLNPSCGWNNVDPYLIPCWSLGALLEMMPDGTSIFYKYNYTTIDMVDVNNGMVRNKHREKGFTILETAYNMIVWLLENGYIKTEKK